QGAGQKGSADQASVKHGSSFDPAEIRPGRDLFLLRDTHIRSRITRNNAQYDFLAPPDRERPAPLILGWALRGFRRNVKMELGLGVLASRRMCILLFGRVFSH